MASLPRPQVALVIELWPMVAIRGLGLETVFVPSHTKLDHYLALMENFIKLAKCNMPKVQILHSKPLKSLL